MGLKYVGQGYGLVVVVDQDWLDWCEVVYQGQVKCFGVMVEMGDQCCQVLLLLVFVVQQFQVFQGGVGYCWWLVGGVDVGLGVLDQGFDQFFVVCYEGVGGIEIFVEGVDQYWYLFLVEVEVFDDFVVVGVQWVEVMCVVDYQLGVVGLCDGGQGWQVGEIVVYVEDFVGDYQGIVFGFVQVCGEVCWVVVQVV